jgi:hypothetical protein
MRGNQSTIAGFTEKLVFLAPSAPEAAYYAKEQSAAAKLDPVIFSVLVQDASLLTVSDDYVLQKGIESMLATAGLPPLEFDDDMDVHEYGASSDAYYLWREIFERGQKNWLAGEPLTAEVLNSRDMCDWDSSFPEMLQGIKQETLAPTIWDAATKAMRQARQDHWTASLAHDRDPAVGYAGAISPAHIELLDPADTLKALKNIRRGDGSPATWNLQHPAPVPGLGVFKHAPVFDAPKAKKRARACP